MHGLAHAEPAVETRVWIEPDHAIVVGQQVLLNIEVATDSWFSGGTHIGRAEIPGTVVLQRERFAVNSTRSRGDATWTVQQYSLTLYPRTAADYRVPPIRLQIRVAGGDGVSVLHRVETNPLLFHATLPTPLAAEREWVTTTQYTVAESFNRSLDHLKPGDAIERRIVYNAVDLPAMMLPEFNPETIDGLATYRKTPLLQDTIDRGSVAARRTEVVTYVVEKPGHYVLRPLRYVWWNLASGSLETIDLPGHLLLSGGVVTGSDAAPGLGRARAIVWLGGLGAIALGALALWMMLRKRAPLQSQSLVWSPESPRMLRRAYRAALLRQDYRAAVAILYRWYALCVPCFHGALRDHLAGANRAALHVERDSLMALAFGDVQSRAAAKEVSVALRVLEPSPRQKSVAVRGTLTLMLNPD